MDVLTGTSGADAISGLDGADILRGRNGDDILDGGDGADALFGDAGDDVLRGGLKNDALDGGQGNDMLFGGEGGDALTGGAGNDTLSGGSGSDVLAGGSGDDVFVFDRSGGSDLVLDFRVGPSGGDVIDVRALPNVRSFDELAALIGQNALGHAVIDGGEHGSMTLVGVRPEQLAADDFLFAGGASFDLI
jgi:Ca2+-binding RTX toxin-like protein